jgi:hypothetical protein
LTVTNLRISFPAGDLPFETVDERAALAILEALFGLSDLPAYDAEIFEEAAIRGMAALVTEDYAAACLVRESILRARIIRSEARLPADLGYRREAIRVAGRVFDKLAGCTVRGEGPLVERLVRDGAVRAEVTPAAIVVTGARRENAAPAPGLEARTVPAPEDQADTLAFELGASVPTARYRFSGAELDAFTRRALATTYPRTFREMLKKGSAEAVRAVRTRMDEDPARSAAAALASIQAGAPDARGDGHERFDAIATASFLSGGGADRSRLVSDFLSEVAAFRKFVPARRQAGASVPGGDRMSRLDGDGAGASVPGGDRMSRLDGDGAGEKTL